MLKRKSLITVMAFAVLAVWTGAVSNVSAITLTEEQKQMAAGLSDKEKADLTGQCRSEVTVLEWGVLNA